MDDNRGNLTYNTTLKEAVENGWTIGDLADVLVQTLTQIQRDDKEEKLILRATSVNHEFGIPANIVGYEYVRYAIIITVKDASYISAMIGRLYTDVASKFETSAGSVERSIRSAVQVAWENSSTKTKKKYFGDMDLKKKPSNGQFIAGIADAIRLDWSR